MTKQILTVEPGFKRFLTQTMANDKTFLRAKKIKIRLIHSEILTKI